MTLPLKSQVRELTVLSLKEKIYTIASFSLEKFARFPAPECGTCLRRNPRLENP